MSFDILNRFTGAILRHSETVDTMPEAVLEACMRGADLAGAYLRGANLRDANLRDACLGAADLGGANLAGAYLRSANLGGANLRGAYLRSANLGGANLRGAYLRGADLAGAYLRSANLRDANLRGAYLRGANLDGAYLRGATMPSGETWEQYLAEVVPALLTAGGRPLAEVATLEHWTCHDWSNCPISAAFGITSESEGPRLLQPRIREFIQFFDAGLIRMPGEKTEVPVNA